MLSVLSEHIFSIITTVPRSVVILHTSIPTPVIAAAALAGILAMILLKLLMRPKYYLFVRHGQTILNAKRIRQGSEGGLTPSGIDQAERTGAFLEPFHIRKIYASPYERTRQTADIIAKHLRCPIVYSPLLTERRNPSEIIGKSTDDPEIRRIGEQLDLTFHDDNYRFSDEENFADLKKRARKALRYLSRRPEHRVCVATHGIFLKMLISYIMYGRRLHAPDWVRVAFFNPADNAGMTLFVYRPWHRLGPSRGWEISSYNITIPTQYSDPSGPGIANLREMLSHR